MRKVNIDNILPKVINGKNIYSIKNSQRLVANGSKLMPEYLKKLKQLGIRYIYIEDDLSEGIEVQEMIPEELYTQTKDSLFTAYNSIHSKKGIVNLKDMVKNVNSIVDGQFIGKNLIVNITDIRLADDYTFHHSVNVCILSIIIGIKLGLNDISLQHLGIGALLHDIGKIKIPLEILNKPSQLNMDEMDKVKKHTEYGFEILKKHDVLNRNSVYISLGHHEWYNGTGYPNKFSKNQIHQYARIVSVADVFDAMTSDRVYRKGVDPSKVLEYLKLMKNKQFDSKIVDTFIEQVLVYPNGTGVTLDTRETALVVNSSINNKLKPIVRIVLDPNGNRYSEFKEVDLSKTNQYNIIGINNDF